MGIGPVSAPYMALNEAELWVAGVDLVAADQAFAAQARAVAVDAVLDSSSLNFNGCRMSRGHPIGATGTVISVDALRELQRTGGRHALVRPCIDGRGSAAVCKRV
jgi:acetyl-CoA C-acetyltransferase